MLFVQVVEAIMGTSKTGSSTRPPKTEQAQALEQCNVFMWARFGYGSVSGPGADVWPVRKTGGFAALYTVTGKNTFGMPVLNTMECEVHRDGEGGWELPFLWNVSLHGDKLDPSSVDAPVKKRGASTPRATGSEPSTQQDASSVETVTVGGRHD
jgi:hypothetical protein